MEQKLPGFDRITVNPDKLGGQPCIRGHRFSVEHLLELLAAGWSTEEIQADLPLLNSPMSSKPCGTQRLATA